MGGVLQIHIEAIQGGHLIHLYIMITMGDNGIAVDTAEVVGHHLHTTNNDIRPGTGHDQERTHHTGSDQHVVIVSIGTDCV